jgi:hypothetical protein
MPTITKSIRRQKAMAVSAECYIMLLIRFVSLNNYRMLEVIWDAMVCHQASGS